MQETSQNLFLLMANLAQVKDKKLLRQMFVDALNNLFKNAEFQWLDNCDSGNYFEVETINKIYGYVAYGAKLSDNDFILLQNATQMLAVFLEKNDQTEMLKSREKHLEVLVEEKTNEIIERDEDLSAIFTNSLNAIIFTDDDGNFISVNDAAVKIFGYPKSRLDTMKISDFQTIFDNDASNRYEDYLKTGKDVGELEFVSGNGVKKVAIYHSVIIRNNVHLTIITDITELRKIREDIQLAKELYETIFETAANMIISVNQAGIIVNCNKRVTEILGYKQEELIGKNLAKIIYREDFEKAIKNIQNVMESGSTYNKTVRMVKADGQKIFTKVNSSGINKSNRKYEIAVCIVDDITESKIAQEKLIESEKKLGNLMSNLPGMAYRCKNDQNWTMLFISQGCKQLTGYDSSELIGNKSLSYLDIIYPDDRKLVNLGIKNGVSQQKQFTVTYRIVKKNGDIAWVWEQGSAYKYKEYNETILEGFITDITAVKRAEQNLRYERDKAQAYLDIAGVMFIAFDKHGNITLVNKKALTILGYSESEILGKNWYQNFLPVEIIEEIKEVGETVLAEKDKKLENFTNEIVTKSGERRLIKWNNKIFRDKAGNIVGLLSAGEDITEIKKAEEALLQNKTFIDKIVNATPNLIYIINIVEGNITYCNPYSNEILGYTPAEITGMGKKVLQKLVHPDDLKMLNSRQQLLLNSNDSEVYQLEYRMKIKTGIYRTFRSWDTVFEKDDSGVPTHYIGITIDITDQKESESIIRENEELFRSTFEQSSTGIAHVSEEGAFLRINEQFSQITGYSHEELLTKNFLDITHPDENNKDLINISSVIPWSSNNHYTEKRCIHKNGSNIRIALYLSAVRDTKNKLKYAVASIIDITKQKRQEIALKESEEKYRSLVENIQDFVFLINKDLKVVSVNKTSTKLFNSATDNIIGKTIFELFPPDVSSKYSNDIEAVFRSGEPLAKNSTLKTKYAKLYISTNLSPIKNDKGEVVAVVGLSRDITQQYLAQEKIRENEVLFRSTFENTPTGIAHIDSNGMFLRVNPEFCTITGYKKEELLSKGYEDITYKKDLKISKEQLQKLTERKAKRVSFEKRYVRKDGTIIWGQLFSSAVRDSDDKIKYFVSSLVNITTRKKMEQALIESETKFRALAEGAPNIIFSIGMDLRIKYINKALDNTPIENIIGKNVSVLTPLNSADFVKSKITETISTQQPVVYEIQNNGYWYNVRIGPVINNNQVESLIFILTDVTEKHKAEEAILKNYEMFQTVMDSIDSMVYVADMENHEILFINKKMEETFGNILGENCYIHIQGKTEPCDFCSNKHLVKNGSPTGNYTWEFQNRENNEWYFITNRAIEWIDGRLVRFEISTNISRIKEYESDLKETLTKTRKINEQLEVAKSELEESENTLNSIFRNAPSIMILLNYEFQIVKINHTEENETLQESLNSRTGDILKCINALGDQNTCGSTINCNNCKINRLIKETSNKGVEYFKEEVPLTIFRNDFIQRRFFLVSSSIVYHAGKRNILVTIDDITEMKLIESEIKIAKERAEKSEKVALENLGKLEKRNAEISSLFAASKIVMEFNEFKVTAQKLYSKCSELLGATMGCVGINTETKNEIEIIFSSNVPNCEDKFNFSDVGLFRNSSNRMGPVVENNLQLSAHKEMLPKCLQNAQNILIAPLIIKNKPGGYVCFANNWKGFGEDDKYIASAFSELLSIALFDSRTLNELISARDNAEKADRLKSEFLAQMSHEIRTPVGAIMSYSQLLHDFIEDNADDTRDILRGMESSGKRIIRTINLILNVSELQSGSYDYIPKKLYLVSDIIANLIYEFKYLAELKGISIELNYENDYQLWIDEYSVTQIFSNLIDNAVKYTESGKITIKVYEDNSSVIAKVKDTGIGISEKYLPHIFEPFTQEAQGYSRKFEGNGLGLKLVSEYSKLNNATVSVTSKKGEGTEFKIQFEKRTGK